jgi:biofilm PGA synthesis N-glycosyltransferase PgaC
VGIRNATGDVLMFVDADGIFSRRTVQRMLQGFEDKRTGAVCGDDRPANLNRLQTGCWRSSATSAPAWSGAP